MSDIKTIMTNMINIMTGNPKSYNVTNEEMV